jgi:hypothetical protein
MAHIRDIEAPVASAAHGLDAPDRGHRAGPDAARPGSSLVGLEERFGAHHYAPLPVVLVGERASTSGTRTGGGTST